MINKAVSETILFELNIFLFRFLVFALAAIETKLTGLPIVLLDKLAIWESIASITSAAGLTLGISLYIKSSVINQLNYKIKNK